MKIILNQLFCAHDFHLVNQFEMKSRFDIIKESGSIPTTWDSTTRRLITDYKCSKCGSLKRLTAKTPK